MNLIFLIFFPLLLLIGGLITYEDYKYFKIRNKWILIGLISCLILYFILYFFEIINFSFVYLTLINFFLSFFLGILFWLFNFWSAGDTKFFSLLSLLVPLIFYNKDSFSYFLSLNILIYALLLLIIKLIYEMFIKFNYKNYILFLKEFNIKQFFLGIIILLLIQINILKFDLLNFFGEAYIFFFFF